jgi:hypothetical protein
MTCSNYLLPKYYTAPYWSRMSSCVCSCLASVVVIISINQFRDRAAAAQGDHPNTDDTTLSKNV